MHDGGIAILGAPSQIAILARTQSHPPCPVLALVIPQFGQCLTISMYIKPARSQIEINETWRKSHTLANSKIPGRARQSMNRN